MGLFFPQNDIAARARDAGVSVEALLRQQVRDRRARLMNPEARQRPVTWKVVRYPEAFGPPRPALPRLAKSPMPIPPRFRAIVQEVADQHGVTSEDIFGQRRFARVVQARQHVAWRVHIEMGWSLNRIGRTLGRDHTTIIHAFRAHQERIKRGEVPQIVKLESGVVIRSVEVFAIEGKA